MDLNNEHEYEYDKDEDEDKDDEDDYDEDSDSDEERHELQRQRIAQWTEQSKHLVPIQNGDIYILTLEEWDHSGNWGRGSDSTVIGVYNSKEAAVAKSVYC